MRWSSFIQKYFGIFFIAAILLGLFLPGFFMPVADYTMLILGTVITLTFLTIDLRIAVSNLKSFHRIAVVLIGTKVLLPILLYRLTLPLGPDISLGVLLLTLTPFAAVAPTLTGIIGGDTEYVLVLHVLTTLLAPFYMPFLLQLYAGSAIEIDTIQMMKNLLYLIIIPFGLSLIIRPLFKGLIGRISRHFGGVNILLISLLLSGLLAKASGDITADPLRALPMFGVTAALGILLALTGWFCFFFLDRRKRTGLAIANEYMNIGLTAVIAAGFFGPSVVMFILIYELPANLLPPVIGKLVKEKCGGN